MIKVSAIAHATFETPDLERMSDYYQHVLGLAVVERVDNVVYLACPLDYHSVVLKTGPVARCSQITLQVPRHIDLNDAAKSLSSDGLSLH